MSNRYIVRFRGSGPRPSESVERMRSMKDSRIVDETSQMLLVEGTEETLRDVFDPNDWLITPEKEIANPIQRPRVRKKPGD